MGFKDLKRPFFLWHFFEDSLPWQQGLVFDGPPSLPSLFRLLSFGWWALGIFSVNFCHGTFSGSSFPRSSLSAVSPSRLFSSGSWVSRILDVRFCDGTFSKNSLSWRRGLAFDDPPSLPSLFRLPSFGWWALGIFSVNFSLSWQQGLAFDGSPYFTSFLGPGAW